jgi:uncharacterized protein YecT (DUF1311 family)
MIARLASIAVLVAICSVQLCAAQTTPKDAAAIRACAKKYEDNITEGERRCVFTLVVDACTKTKVGQSSQGAAGCYRGEQEIWDEILNENFRTLGDGLDDDQKEKLRDMQHAWIAYRNTTCEFYYHKIRGSMSTEMTAACLARETARRALLLKFFQGL